MSSSPQRILLLRPDAYGDLILFEPVLRLLRAAWPQAEIGLLIGKPRQDIIPLFPGSGIQWLTTGCNPYREAAGENRAALDALRETVRAFDPDCLVAACAEQTWLEPAVAAFLPEARQVSLGSGLNDPLARAALDAEVTLDWNAIYPEKIPVLAEQTEWERNLALAGTLLGREVPRWWPALEVPPAFQAQAADILAAAGLEPGTFVACAVAGTANVAIKHWPADDYGQTLAWLEREHGIRALLIGHASERAHLEAVRLAASRAGSEPALWLGRDGEMPLLAGLLAAARFYFGNDTGPLHLAAALGKPVVSIFGGGTWPRFHPVARRSVTLVQPLPCFGCAWDCYFVDAPCIRTISPASVQQALNLFLRDEADLQTVFHAEGLEDGLRALIDTATPRLRFQRADSLDRLRQVRLLAARATELSDRLQSSDADRFARQIQVKELTALLQESEADRSARQVQVKELTALLQESEADRSARLQQVNELTALLQESEADRSARLLQIKELSARLQETEADRSARVEPALGSASQTIVEDLQLRLQGAYAQVRVARTAARQLSRELALMRRLVKFFFDGPPPSRVNRTGEIQCQPAVLLTERVIYHLEVCQNQGTHTAISGWAFRPARDWDASATSVTLLFRSGYATYSAPTRRVARPDIAAYFAAQPPEVSGGAIGLAGMGFAGEVLNESLPAGVELKIALRLECAGKMCEHATTERVRL
jgi:ADP-heptose:LPS heptosyltransferase